MDWLKSHVIFRLKVLIYKLPASPKKAQNLIKIKCSLVVFSLFVNILADWPCFCFEGLVAILTTALIVSLAISGVMLIALKIVIGLLQ